MEHGSDICECGDWRSQHQDHEGACDVPFCECLEFSFWKEANELERKDWEKHHPASAARPSARRWCWWSIT